MQLSSFDMSSKVIQLSVDVDKIDFFTDNS